MVFITSETDLQFAWKTYSVQALYFYRSNMPFHAKIINIIEQLQLKHKQTAFYAIDVDQFTSSCIRFDITSIPALVIFKDAKEIKRLEGTVKTKDFINIFDDICTL